MAVKKKQTVEYFPFVVKDGRTLYVLQQKYGLFGIGFFTQVMRWLAQQPGHFYVYIEDFDRDRFNQYCGINETDTRNMLNDMARTGKIDRELWEENVIFSQDFVDELVDAYRKRSTELPTKESVMQETAGIRRSVENDVEMPEKPHSAGIRRNPPEKGADSGKSRESAGIAAQSRVDESRVDESREAPSAEPDGSPPAVIDETQNLYNQIKSTFEAEQPNERFTDYGKEGASIRGLIKKATVRSPDDPERFAMGMIEAFRELRKQDKFFKGQPFLPSALNSSGIYDRVLSWAYERHRKDADDIAILENLL